MFRRLLERFELTNRRHSLLKKGDRVVVGVSGGPDSLALLRFLSALGQKYALTVHAAYLDHGLQKDSAKAAALVREEARKLGVAFHSGKAKVREEARRKRLSLEDAGREARYRFFGRIAKKVKAGKIATAHTLDDQAETVLMRLVRGAGLRGLAGIPHKRSHGKLEIVRPFLDCSKKELMGWLKKERASFLRDKMNRDPLFLRNRVRHELLPFLSRRFNPQMKEVLSSLRSVCLEAQDYLRDEASVEFRRCLVKSVPKSVTMNAARLKGLHPALRHEVMAAAVVKLKGHLAGFGYAHWAAADRLLNSAQKNGETHWPHRVRVKKRGLFLVLSTR